MRRRLALTTAAISTMIVAAFLVPLAVLVRDVAEDRALSDAERGAQTLAPVLTAVGDEASVERIVSAATATGIGEVSVFLDSGTVLGAPARPDDAVAAARDGAAVTAAVPGGMAVLVPVVGPDGTTDVVRILVPDSQLREGVAAAWLVLGLLGVALVIVALIVADRLGRSVVEPMGELARTAERLGQGDLDARVTPAGPPEVAEVGTTLNRLADRIDELLDAERESVADLSHRLRTPVTTLRLDTDGLRDPDERSRLAEDVDALTTAIDRVIRDARQRVGAGAAPRADLVRTARERVAFWSALAEDQGRAYEARLPDEPIWVGVAPGDLEAALDALINNVFAHTAEADAFRVVVTPAGSGAAVTVEDDGPGLADRDRALARGTSGHGSTGLGLDIARRTAESSGGRLVVETPATGGTRVTMELGQPRPLLPP